MNKNRKVIGVRQSSELTALKDIYIISPSNYLIFSSRPEFFHRLNYVIPITIHPFSCGLKFDLRWVVSKVANGFATAAAQAEL